MCRFMRRRNPDSSQRFLPYLSNSLGCRVACLEYGTTMSGYRQDARPRASTHAHGVSVRTADHRKEPVTDRRSAVDA